MFKVAIAVIFCVPAYNFSHRIDHLSFGEDLPGIISPLDGTEKVSADCTSVLSLTPFQAFEIIQYALSNCFQHLTRSISVPYP